MESIKMAEDIKNLLLKIVLPLAFPLAGSFISDLIARRGNNRLCDASDCSIQVDQSQEEEEEQEMESTGRASRKLAQTEDSAGRFLISEFSRQGSNAAAELVAASQGSEESSAEVAVNPAQDEDVGDELVALRRLVRGLEERACSIESQFHGYCEAKEQESAYQKMQIMCLGMKLELLESRASQRLEVAAGEIAAVRGRLDALRGKVRRVASRRKRDAEAVGERVVALEAGQARTAWRCDEVERCVEEMRRLTVQLQERTGAAHSEEVEVAVERSLRKLSSGRELVDGLEALRDRWAADMEEMIYLGWITAWLQHDLLLSDDNDDDEYGGREFGTVVVGEDDGPLPVEEEERKKKGDTMVAAVAPSNEVQLCKAASSSSAASSSVTSGPPRRSVDAEPSCMGFAAAGGCNAGLDGGGIGRPRLLRKLRGWAAGGKGRGKRPCRIAGPCCQK